MKKMNVIDGYTVQIPAGKYVLGDPYYCFGVSEDEHRSWLELLGSCDHFEQPVGEVNGYHLIKI